MEQNNRADILRRIRGLLAKTTGNGCTESEALAAASLLAKLVDKYGFTPIDLEEPMEKLTEILVSAKGASPALHYAVAVSEYCDCPVLNRKSSGTLVFFGTEVDSMLAEYLMSLLSHAHTTGWKAYLKAERIAGKTGGSDNKEPPPPMKFVNLVGQRFGSLQVIARAENLAGKITWMCRCDCGGETRSTGGNLRTGTSTNCGCVRRAGLAARSTTHGLGKPPEWGNWISMLKRCYNPKTIGYKYWGGRGISVCDAWRNDFGAFYRDMGPKPSPKHSLDRYPDNSGNYEPGNVRWATQKEQVANSKRYLRVR